MQRMLKMLVFACVVIAVTGGYAVADENTTAQQFIEANNSFAVDVYGKLCQKEGNLFLSPYSISSALAMTYAGARGETASQMAQTLHFTLDHGDLHQAFARVATHFHEIGQSGDIALAIANAIWVQKSVELLKDFVDLVETQYHAGLFPVNFMETPEEARKIINGWVEKQTNQRIQNLLPKGALNKFTRLVLTNAIYFKGKWDLPFEKDATTETSFWIRSEKNVQVPMMQQQHTFKYGETETLQILQMPYAGEELSMVIVLPSTRDGLQTLEHQLTEAQLAEWQDTASMREVNVWLPKFTITSQFSLAETLQEMGMVDAFSTSADFSGMVANARLNISDVLHKAFVEVNEEGTEAAAATAVTIELTSVREPEPIPEFRADHPFLFLIQDNQTKSILFLGRVVNPNASEQ